jgi:hypothetical protein
MSKVATMSKVSADDEQCMTHMPTVKKICDWSGDA